LFAIPTAPADDDTETDEKTAKKAKQEAKDELNKKDKALLAYIDKELDGKGFVPWTKVEHPDFENVEVGGYVPYLETTPKPVAIDSLLKTQLPWLLRLSQQLPTFKFENEKITAMGGGIYKIELFVANNGALAHPIAMGQRNSQPAPLVLTLDGEIDFLEGKKRTPVGAIGANQVKKYTWLIKSNKSKKLSVTLESATFTDVVKQIKIGG